MTKFLPYFFSFLPYICTATISLWGILTLLRGTYTYFEPRVVRKGGAVVIGLLLLLDFPLAMLISSMRSFNAPLFPTLTLVDEEQEARSKAKELARQQKESEQKRQELSDQVLALLSGPSPTADTRPLREVVLDPPEKRQEEADRRRRERAERDTRFKALKEQQKQQESELAHLKQEQEELKQVWGREQMRTTLLFAGLGWLFLVRGLAWLLGKSPRPEKAAAAQEASGAPPEAGSGPDHGRG